MVDAITEESTPEDGTDVVAQVAEDLKTVTYATPHMEERRKKEKPEESLEAIIDSVL